MINQISREHSGALGRCEQRDGFPVVLAGRAQYVGYVHGPPIAEKLRPEQERMVEVKSVAVVDGSI